MNRAGVSGPLVDELISKLTLTEQASAAFAKLRERCDATLKDSSTWGRTDPFAVQKHLDGLQEKFRIFNKDDFADALANRLLELDNQRSPYAPEFLSLLLQLSDRPVDVSKIPVFEKASDTAPLSVEFNRVGLDDAGSAFANEDIWAEVDYGAASSDSESSIVSSEISIPKLLPQRPQPSHDEFVIPEEFLSSGADDELIATIKSGHFWEYDSAAVRKFSESHTRFITELEAAREILFMLQGLPTSLFWQIDGSIAVDRRYAFTHVSNPAFLHILRAAADIGVRLGKLRKFTQMPQSAVFLQTFVRGIEKELALFDAFLSRKQRSYLSTGDLVTVSLLQLTEEVRAEARVLMLLADLVTELASAPPEHSFLCLDLLYDLVCDKQSSGHTHEYRSLAKLFFSCFDAYAQPLRLWLSSGDLDDLHKRDQFFIVDRGHDRGLSTLWQEWYVLKETDGRLHAPKFIKPSARKILTTGKSMVLLRNLKFPINEFDSTSAYRKFNFSFEDLDDTSCQLLPFPILLDQAVEDLISTNYILASRTLRDQLREKCALWPTLSALHYIYLCRDGSISATIDRKIFESLDRGNEFWRDRFLLTELVEIAFSETVSVDTSRILVRPSGDKLENMGSGRSQELGILGSISIEYVVPWPVANIVGKSAISIYQRISAFLMQIRRTKSVLERQKFSRAGTKYTDTGEDDERLSYTLRHHLLWFTNTLYGHLTEMVIATNVAAMEKSLAESPDIDSMIFVYGRFMSALEGQCLLSPKLQPIHRAIIDLLELCVHFADIRAARHEDTNKFNQLHRGPTVINRRNQHLRKKRSYHNGPRLEVDASDDDDSFDHGDQNSEDDDTDKDDYDEGNTTSISFIELSYSQRLKSLKQDFHQSLAFVIAGLRSVERVDEQQNWDILADRLSWSTQSK